MAELRRCVVCGEKVPPELVRQDRITCSPPCYDKNTRKLAWMLSEAGFRG